MKYLYGLLAAIMISLSASAVAAAQTPSPAATQTSVPTPAPSPNPTPKPPAVNGIPCKSGLLLNGMLVIGPNDVPPECSVTTIGQTPPVVYGLKASPDYVLLSEQVDRFGVIEVDYAAPPLPPVGGPPLVGRPAAIRIILQPTYDSPHVIQIPQGGGVSAASNLPAPGVTVDVAIASSQVPEADWIGNSGLYRLIVDPRLIPLSLAEVVGQLTPIQLVPPSLPAPSAPSTGSGAAPATANIAPLVLGGVALMSASVAFLVAAKRRRSR